MPGEKFILNINAYFKDDGIIEEFCVFKQFVQKFMKPII